MAICKWVFKTDFGIRKVLEKSSRSTRPLTMRLARAQKANWMCRRTFHPTFLADWLMISRPRNSGIRATQHRAPFPFSGFFHPHVATSLCAGTGIQNTTNCSIWREILATCCCGHNPPFLLTHLPFWPLLLRLLAKQSNEESHQQPTAEINKS